MKNITYFKPHEYETYLWEHANRKADYLWIKEKLDTYNDILEYRTVPISFEVENERREFFTYNYNTYTKTLKNLDTYLEQEIKEGFDTDENDICELIEYYKEYLNTLYAELLRLEHGTKTQHYLYKTKYVMVDYTAKEKLKNLISRIIRNKEYRNWF